MPNTTDCAGLMRPPSPAALATVVVKVPKFRVLDPLAVLTPSPMLSTQVLALICPLMIKVPESLAAWACVAKCKPRPAAMAAMVSLALLRLNVLACVNSVSIYFPFLLAAEHAQNAAACDSPAVAATPSRTTDACTSSILDLVV